MIRRNQEFLNKVNIVLDMLLVMAAYALASWIWIGLLNGSSDNMAALGRTSVFLSFVYAVGVFALLSALNFYNTNRTRRLSWKLRTIFIAVTVAVLIASTVLFIFKLVDFSRGVLYLFYILTLALLAGKYVAMRLVFSRMRSRGYNLKHLLVIGTGKLARQFAKDAEEDRSLGFHIAGFTGKAAEDLSGYLGGHDTLEEQLASGDIQEAVIALDPDEYERIPEMIAACEKYGVKYYIIPFYNDVIPAHPVIETVGKSKLIDMRANRLDSVGWSTVKRTFDIIASAAGLVVLSPLFLVIAAGVKLSSPGPVLFRQTRVGHMKKTFSMLKFRSMRVNAESETAWSRVADDRRTRFGAILRKTSLDELPQLINVLKGDMSLVGPRPELPYFVEQFKETIPLYMVKHQVKPGMTGWAQVNGYRGDTDIAERVRLDIWYIDNWTVRLDIRILFRTVFGGAWNKERLYAGKDA